MSLKATHVSLPSDFRIAGECVLRFLVEHVQSLVRSDLHREAFELGCYFLMQRFLVTVAVVSIPTEVALSLAQKLESSQGFWLSTKANFLCSFVEVHSGILSVWFLFVAVCPWFG